MNESIYEWAPKIDDKDNWHQVPHVASSRSIADDKELQQLLLTKEK